jgi:hypothetical protein
VEIECECASQSNPTFIHCRYRLPINLSAAYPPPPSIHPWLACADAQTPIQHLACSTCRVTLSRTSVCRKARLLSGAACRPSDVHETFLSDHDERESKWVLRGAGSRVCLLFRKIGGDVVNESETGMACANASRAEDRDWLRRVRPIGDTCEWESHPIASVGWMRGLRPIVWPADYRSDVDSGFGCGIVHRDCVVGPNLLSSTHLTRKTCSSLWQQTMYFWYSSSVNKRWYRNPATRSDLNWTRRSMSRKPAP